MSDINEEQKRLYKRAEEFDKKYNKYLQKKIVEANNRINKAIEYIEECHKSDFIWSNIVYKELKEILKGDNK